MTLPELKQMLAVMGAIPAARIIESAEQELAAEKRHREEAEKSIETLQERLKQAMGRENGLKQQAATLAGERDAARKEVAEAVKKMEEYAEHPAVKEKRRAALQEQMSRIAKEVERLAEPEPEAEAKPVTKPAGKPAKKK